MRIQSKQINPKALKIIRAVGKVADQKKISAFLVGGIVRDILLGLENFDIDILVSDSLSSLAQEVATAFSAELTVHEKFRTASLWLQQGLRVDLSAFRSEEYSAPGALPTVSTGTLEQDLFRRDFTINALAMCINQKDFGKMIDPFNGYEDLKFRRIRVFHEKSFQDDPTRILRAIRFSQRFGFRIEPKTKVLLSGAISSGGTNTVTPQRYFAEFKKILMEENPLAGLKYLHAQKGLSFLCASVDWDFSLVRKVYQKVQKSKGQKAYGRVKKIWLIYFAALIQCLPAEEMPKMIEQIGLSADEKKTILQLRDFSAMIDFLNRNSVSPSAIFHRLSGLSDESLFFLQAVTGKKKVLENISFFCQELQTIRLKVSGNDLQKMGIPDGVGMGKILKRLFELKLNKGLQTKRQELSELKNIMKEGKK